MSKPMGGLTKWFNQKWVDIGSKRKDGSFAPCGRQKLMKDRNRKFWWMSKLLRELTQYYGTNGDDETGPFYCNSCPLL